MNRPRVYKRTTRLMLFFTAVLLGLGWARLTQPLPNAYVWVLAIFTFVSFRKARLLSVYVVVMCGLSIGLWRGGIYMSHVHELSNLSKEKVVLVGTALSDSVYSKSQVSFDMGGLNLEEPYSGKIVGKVGVAGFGEAMIYRGDQVRVSGKFYPARGSLVAYLSYSKLEVTGRSKSVAYSITRRFAAGLENTLPEPLASFALGLLIGQRNALPRDVTAVLSAVGLTHIIAVSGYNLTIMIRAGKRIFGKRSKFQTFVGSQSLIFGFLLVTGLSASIVRAAIISSISLGAWYYGKNLKPLLLILFTAALTAFWNPLYIWSDIGWYLSFMAFFGVMILGPQIRKRLFKKNHRGIIGELVMETLSAQLMTLPIVLYIFKTSSFIALPANVLVVPLIPLAMLLSFIAGIAGMLIPSIAGWFSFPARYILTYLLDIAKIFSHVPNMKFMVTVSLTAMIIMYGAILFVLIILWQKNNRSAKITEVTTSIL